MSFNAPVRVRAKFFREGDRKFFVKGATYGPFAPDADGRHFGTPDKARADLAMMREAGLNLARVYYVPPKWFLDACAEHGIRCLISIPWAEHIEFLNQRKTRREVEKAVVDAVEAVAPNVDAKKMVPNRSLRDQAELDSMDFLNFIEGIHKSVGVEIPERDYRKVDTLESCVDYLLEAKKSQGGV